MAANNRPQTSVEEIISEVRLENSPIDYNNLDPHWTLQGQGAQGTVYTTKLHGTTVAVKVSLENHINLNNAAMIVREIKILQQINHPQIVQFMGICVDPVGSLCIVTEYLPGGSLFHLLHKPKQEFSLRSLFCFAIDICKGMAYMHAQDPKILHRDLKSLNILITENCDHAKIADFGFARLYTQTMSTRGTERWCAPEILSGDSNYNESVDVYSFGIVLWEMCTRSVPYGRQNGEEIVRRVVNDDLRPEFPDEMPDILRDIYEECVSSNPNHRRSFTEILKQLSCEEAVNTPDVKIPHPNDCSC